MLKKTYRLRLLLLGFLSLVVFSTIEARLYYLQVVRHPYFVKRAAGQQSHSVTLIPRRGEILDRNGNPLATSHFTDSVVFDTALLKGLPADALDDVATDLAGILNRSPDAVWNSYFAKPKTYTIMLKATDDLTTQTKALTRKYDLPDGTFDYPESSKREYPNGSLASHVVGYTTIDRTGDNIGQAGIELEYNDWLSGSYEKAQTQVTASQRQLDPLDEETIDQTYGDNVVLTIDSQIQMFAEKALRTGVSGSRARGGVAVVMDVKTGQILALASCPDFDPNFAHDGSQTTPLQLKNRPLSDPIEIGSVMKIITSSLLLENGLLSPDEMINCHDGEWQFGRRRLRDDHPLGTVAFRTAFAESSNIALATVGMRMEPQLYYKGLVRFGLGARTGIDLPGEDDGRLRPPEEWTELSRSSLPIGFETSLTAIQVVTALATVGNGGWRMRPYLVKEIRNHAGQLIKRIEPEKVVHVISEQTAHTMWNLMEGVVLGGTGEKAQVPGYRVGGKTGTTPKSVKKEDRKYYASFAGLLPIDNPQLAIYIYIDEPSNGQIYGGAVAAPVFREIALQAAPLLDIKPSDPAAYNLARARMNGGFAETTATLAALGANSADAAEIDAAPEPALPVELSRAVVVGGKIMPDCRGLTMIDAIAHLDDAGVHARMLGSGVAVSQEPPPGSGVGEQDVVTVIFAHPSEAGKGTAEDEPAKAPREPILIPAPGPLKTSGSSHREKIQ